ncbi:hypothetical protein ZTR_10186 [Talaromyces verruculosus]|nr:hypothetical protein ZTR_10186 [Talaromyces verruculosus]
MCVILRKVTLTKMQVSDFQYALSQLGNCHILLSRDERGANSIRILNSQESISHFNAMSYPLEFSTSSLEERQVESVVTLPLQQAILFCKRSNTIDDSPVGVYWRWWRKMKKEERSSRPGEDKWIWKVQSNMMPSPGAVRQPPLEECSLGFLECRIVLPAYCPPLSLTQLSPIEIASSKHYIKWIMVKMTRGDPSSSPDNYDLKSKFFFSTFEYAEIPNSPLELFDHCLTQLGQEWDDICDAAETHLSTMRSMTFAAKGQNSNLIDVHLKDATTWAGLDTTQATQAKFLNELLRVYDPSRWSYLDGIQFNIDCRSSEIYFHKSEYEASELDNVCVSLADVYRATAILTISAWIMFKRNPGLEDRLEKYFDLLFHKEILRDEEKAGWERRKRTMQYSTFGKKRS